MSVYVHRRTKKLYAVLCSSFDVSRQEHHKVYMCMETGQVFNRSQLKFAENFQLRVENPQRDIVAKEPHE